MRFFDSILISWLSLKRRLLVWRAHRLSLAHVRLLAQERADLDGARGVVTSTRLQNELKRRGREARLEEVNAALVLSEDRLKTRRDAAYRRERARPGET
jgi:hypothetical protein